ncbi:DNA alkylation repair protein [Erysipelothrix enhydrae]|uniref:DNA alkylation repair protein n=1 Tax=Erysipelothrix enhydrae TaxID=2890314 RepID=UPI002B24AFD3|nr:DNA alkylation repair protein [Erysipelothrix sp. 4322-04]WRB86728.1 DNA alkylation repair protein [Erysipelothrix sp. 4322-04]
MKTWTVESVVLYLDVFKNESRRKTLMKQGANDKTVGVPLGIMRKLAKEIGKDHQLALSLWELNIIDYQLLAVLLFDPNELDEVTVFKFLNEIQVMTLQEDLIFRCLVFSQDKDVWVERLKFETADHLGRVYWTFVVDAIKRKQKKELELMALLDEIEVHLVRAHPLTQWMMNRALCEIGFGYSEFVDRAYEIGEASAVYKDMKVAKGCTSAYAPYWMDAVLKRNV